jgi:putative transcriptional regulator
LRVTGAGLDTIGMVGSTNLTNQFLIAMPGLRDPNFARTVTYICEHSDKGAMGIVVNRPLDLSVADVMSHMQIADTPPEIGQQMVYLGGPVESERGFVLHSGTPSWNSTLRITDAICVTTSRDILEAMARGQGPERTLVALGYAGWAGGQLEHELQDNAWLSGPADARIIFDLPAEERWAAAARLLGVDLNLISSEAGHA